MCKAFLVILNIISLLQNFFSKQDCLLFVQSHLTVGLIECPFDLNDTIYHWIIGTIMERVSENHQKYGASSDLISSCNYGYKKK